MKKKELTPEQIEAKRLKDLAIKERRLFKSLVTKVINSCKQIGSNAMLHQLDFLKSNDTMLPEKEITKERNINAFEVGIYGFTHGLDVKEAIEMFND
jgi:hypothetical protein